jgi:AAHS family 4-hydroxybenzoate transporter-like MFS transporter
MGYLMSALGPRRTTIAQLVLAAPLIGVLANEHGLPSLIWSLSILLGVSVQGAQAGLNALVAAYYPTSVRSTGLGWALGIGRVGSIIGPMLGELALLLHWSLHDIFMSGMIPALVAAGALTGVALRHQRRSAAPAATPTPSVQAE